MGWYCSLWWKHLGYGCVQDLENDSDLCNARSCVPVNQRKIWVEITYLYSLGQFVLSL